MRVAKVPCTKYRACQQNLLTRKRPFGRRVAKTEIVICYASFTDEVDKRDHLGKKSGEGTMHEVPRLSAKEGGTVKRRRITPRASKIYILKKKK